MGIPLSQVNIFQPPDCACYDTLDRLCARAASALQVPFDHKLRYASARPNRQTAGINCYLAISYDDARRSRWRPLVDVTR